MNEPICVQKARDIGTLDGIRLIIAWMRKNNKAEDELAKVIDIYDKTYNLNFSAMDVAKLLMEQSELCELAKKLNLCDETNCELHKSPIERMISDVDLDSVIINYTTGVIKFKIRGRTELIKLDELIKIKSKDGKVNASYDIRIIFNIYLKTYLEPCDPNTLSAAEIEKMLNLLKDNAVIVEDISEEGIIENIFAEFIANLRFRSFNEIGKCIMTGRGFIHEKENAMYVKAGEVYRYIQENSGYGTKRILEVLTPYLIKKNKSASFVMNIKDEEGYWEAYRFLVFSLDAIKRVYKTATGQELNIEYEQEYDFQDQLNELSKKYRDVDNDEVKYRIIQLCNNGINQIELIDKIVNEFNVSEEFVEQIIESLKKQDEVYQDGMTIKVL